MKRTWTVLAPAVLGALVAASPALARAGGGSSGFGGSGRGGGFGRGLGGNGHFIFIPVGGGAGVALFILVLVIALLVLPRLLRWWRGQQTSGAAAFRPRDAGRQRRAELAAAEAAEEDAAFSPERVRSEASRLFIAIQAAWDGGDRAKLRRLVAPGLLVEWERRLDDFDRKGWRNRVQPIGEPSVSYVGLTNRGDDRTDRVVVQIDARLTDYVEDAYGRRVGRVDAAGEVSRVREFWTLAKRDGEWILQSIEQGAEGSHQLTDPVVATPWADQQALHDEALIEGAVQDALPEGTKVAEVADLEFEGDARAAALDLSLADGRFAPDIVEVAARRAVAAWVDGVDGDDGPLRALSRPEAVDELLHPGDPSGRTRLVVRGLEVRRIAIVSLDAAAEPAMMTIDVDLVGRRYLEDRATAAVVAGSQSRPTTFTERWTLALDGPAEQPWRIVGVAAPAARG
jgi:predicted lipid-binding transport protein (Tim44 family)